MIRVESVLFKEVSSTSDITNQNRGNIIMIILNQNRPTTSQAEFRGIEMQVGDFPEKSGYIKLMPS